jgi:hypothetical protein
MSRIDTAHLKVIQGVTHTARDLQLSERRVRELADSGALPCIRDATNRRVFTKHDVDVFRTQRNQK